MYMPVESGIYKVNAGGNLKELSIGEADDRLILRFGYNKILVSEVKSFHGARWNPENKYWTVPNNQRNRWRLRSMASGFVGASFASPFQLYDGEPKALERASRFHKVKQQEVFPYKHQYETYDFIVARRQCIIAEEMGLGKSLAVIMAMEWAKRECGFIDFWYIGPKSGVKAVEREFIIWNSPIRPKMMTYEEMVSRGKRWTSGDTAPEFLWFDESSRIKNSTTQRSQAARQFADGVREDHGDDGFIVLTTGTPAPKSPADWWHQCEVACPGFIKEGDIFKFRNRLGLIISKESTITQGVYPHLITWWDDENKCQKCGQPSSAPIHDSEALCLGVKDGHPFIKSVNEVEKLYRRMKGLVLVKFKKDCLDLPPKLFEIIEVKPSQSVLRAAATIAKTSKTTIQGLTLLRELSDGFQYIKTKTDEITCPLCEGRTTVVEKEEVQGSCPNCRDLPKEFANEYGNQVLNCPQHQPEWIDAEHTCPNCGGKSTVPAYERGIKEVACPKDDVLKDLLEAHEESGRFVVFGGFEGTIDRCVRIAHQQGWGVIRVDGRGWQFTDAKGKLITDTDYLSAFQDRQDIYEKICLIGHPKSGGMALTLTASRGTFFYSNTFDSEDRTQAMDRIHRPGMDVNAGATIYDVIHLPSDRKVLDNLEAKRKLELMSLGELCESLNSEGERDVS